MKTIHVNISQPEFDAMTKLVEETDLAFADLLRRAIDAFILHPQVTFARPLHAAKEESTEPIVTEQSITPEEGIA